MEVGVNEVQRLNLTSQNTRVTANNYANQIWLHDDLAGSTVQSLYVDDCYICDGTGYRNNGFLGSSAIHTLYPNGPGASTQWSVSGAPTNWEAVDEPVNNGANFTDYVWSRTDNNMDSYTFANVPAGVGPAVHGLQVSGANSYGGFNPTNFRFVARPASTNYFSSDVAGAPSPGRFRSRIRECNPETGSPWTIAEVDNAQFGVQKLPLVGSDDILIAQLVVEVLTGTNPPELALKRGIRINLYYEVDDRQIDDALADDAADLFGTGPVYFVGRLADDDPSIMQKYADAFNRLKSRRPGSEGVVLLPKELVGMAEADPSAPLTYAALPGFPLANQYIDLFMQRARTIADYLVPLGIQKFIFYNEPNVASDPYPVMPFDRFASLLYYCWYHSIQPWTQAEGYAGPVKWDGDAGAGPGQTGGVSTLLDQVHSWLQTNANLHSGWPWDAATFTQHFGATDPTNWSQWRAVLDGYNDGARFALTEWGEWNSFVCARIAANYAEVVVPGEECGLKEIYFYSYDVHPDPVEPQSWGLVSYGQPPGSQFYSLGMIWPDRACADPYIG